MLTIEMKILLPTLLIALLTSYIAQVQQIMPSVHPSPRIHQTAAPTNVRPNFAAGALKGSIAPATKRRVNCEQRSSLTFPLQAPAVECAYHIF